MGHSHLHRYELDESVSDLNEARAQCAQAVSMLNARHADPTVYYQYARVLHVISTREPSRASIDAAIDLFEKAISKAKHGLQSTHDHTLLRAECDRLASFQIGLSNALRQRYDFYGEEVDIEMAIEVVVNALNENLGQPIITLLNFALANALFSRSERTGSYPDLKAAAEKIERIIKSCPTPLSAQVPLLITYSNLLQCMFEKTGDVADLNRSIQVLEFIDWPRVGKGTGTRNGLQTLSIGLAARYRSQGSVDDLNAAIRIGVDLISGMRTDDLARPGVLNNTALLLLHRYDRFGVMRDLRQADEYSSEALSSEAYKWHFYYDTTRSRVLCELYKTMRWRADIVRTLDEAILRAERVVDISANEPQNPDRAIYQHNLARALLAKWEYFGSPPELLDRAAYALADAARIVAEDNPDRYDYLYEMAEAGIQSNSGEIYERFLLRTVLKAPLAATSTRAKSGHALAKLLAKNNDLREASLSSRAAVQLLQDIAPSQLELADRQFLLSGFGQLVSEAAMIMTTAGSSTLEIIRTLEQGRGVIISQILDSRSDLTELEAQHPDLAKELKSAREALDIRTGTSIRYVTSKGQHYYIQRTVGHIAAQKIRQVINLIRTETSFSNFLMPPVEEDLLALSDRGAIAMINVADSTAYGLDESKGAAAYLLHNRRFKTLPLPNLKLSKLNRLTKNWQAAQQTMQESPTEASATLRELLSWLYDVLAAPILNLMDLREPDDPLQPLNRIWWITSGQLGILPLHAAGTYDSGSVTSDSMVMDRVISSYAPTLKTLIYSHQSLARTLVPTQSAPTTVLVAMPTTPKQAPLPHATAEVNRVASLIPITSTILAEPTTNEVLSALQSAAYVHLATHGFSNASDPSKSALLLSDGALDVRKITRARLAKPRLAYLSACQTLASEGEELRDECLHITSAFQCAGFPHVVGTLWAVWDRCAADIGEEFWKSLIQYKRSGDREESQDVDVSGDRVARALHQAVKKLRDRGEDIIRWGSFVHSGI
ncbi:hypothetical protein H2201_003594 [Coniosporium apollinis]|uniref:CHAT domain-containing protein n=1 Tax=Coniosporium apollinis TaxID=61459 RepID=A0ABQ9NVJ3_9PEZI|nr:hypothetical protein H2201_003594 [Coniosporium apollinis]